MKRVKLLVHILILAVVFLAATSASADPILVTSGFVHYSQTGAGSFSLVGSGFMTSGSTVTLNPAVSLFANGPITPGGVGLTGGSVDSQDGEITVSLPIIVDGISYSPTSSLLELSFNSLLFNAPFTSSGFIVTAPFSLTSGIIEGFPGELGQGNPLFSALLTGQGTTVLTFLRTPGGQYQLQSQSFIFGQSASGVLVQTVPEPSTAFLFLSGVLALGGYYKKRR